MKRLILCGFVAFALPLIAATKPNLVGKTEAEILVMKGTPLTKVIAGNRHIYTWLDAVVTCERGRVSKVEPHIATDAEKRKAQAEAKKQRDRAINDKYLADSIAEHAAGVRREEEQKLANQQAEMRQRNEERDRLAESNRTQNMHQVHADAKRRDKENERRNEEARRQYAERNKPPIVIQTIKP